MWKSFHIIVIPLIIAVCLLGNYSMAAHLPMMGNVCGRLVTIFHDPAKQKTFFLLAFFCCVGFTWLSYLRTTNSFWKANNPDLWLNILGVIGLLRCFYSDSTSSNSIQVLILLAGLALAKGINVLMLRLTPRRFGCVFLGNLVVIICILLIGIFADSPKSIYRYHDLVRWVGIWDNPNTFGLLMGTGVTLALGVLMPHFTKPEENIIAAGEELKSKNGKYSVIYLLMMVFFALASGCMGMALFKSYSRGAWLGTLCGLAYLFWSNVKSSRIFWPVKSWLPLSVILASVAVIIFWQFRFSESPSAQRIFSVANANDFSWRNRVTAWGGAMHMVADKPLFGFGWGQASLEYEKNYLPKRLDDPTAIQMNDYFMIGISAGVPALFCFAAYLALSFRRRPAGLSPPISIFTVCRSGAIVLLVGFWFDGGLFKLPVATLFWTLMELSRIQPFTPPPVSPVKEAEVNDARSGIAVAPKRGTGENRLRWLAGVLAVLATTQTIIYLGTPFLPVSDGTLAVARKCFIQRNEAEDFDFLATNSVWRGQKLKVLLEHVRLSNYNRQLTNWKLDDKMCQDFVLSPVITGDANEQMNWRRPLWEEFYPSIRHEASPEDAAKIVLRHLHERVTIAPAPNLPHDVPDIWLKQITDETGFEIISVAALRSVGVPARLDSNGHAEFWDGNHWQTAPLLTVIN